LLSLHLTIELDLEWELKGARLPARWTETFFYLKRPGGSAQAGMEAHLLLPGAFAETLDGHGFGKPMPVFSS